MNKNMHYLMIIILGLFYVESFAQREGQKRIQLLQRTPFYSVDENYKLIPGVIYYANEGFELYAGYDVDTIDQNGDKYVILTYPDWSSRKEKQEQKRQQKIRETRQKQVESQLLYTSRNLNIELDLLDSLANEIIQTADSGKGSFPLRKEIVGISKLRLAIPLEKFERLKAESKIRNIYSTKGASSFDLTSGFMSIPFKLRPKQDSVNFNLTTDVTLGAYLGVKKRISRLGENYIILPFTLGLTYINVSNSKTSAVNTEEDSNVVPGWSWSTGLVVALDGFNLGFVLGQDFASGVGDKWLYNRKVWYSFSIGYSFFSGNSE